MIIGLLLQASWYLVRWLGSWLVRCVLRGTRMPIMAFRQFHRHHAGYRVRLRTGWIARAFGELGCAGWRAISTTTAPPYTKRWRLFVAQMLGMT